MSIIAKLRLHKKKKNSFFKGEIELHLVKFLCSKKGISIDIGANKGNYTLEMSKYSKGVISIEPNIRYNKYLNKMPNNCSVMNNAVTSLKDNIFLHVPVKNSKSKFNEAFISQNKSEPNTKLVSDVLPISLDYFIDKNIKMIKIDVEGNEMDVLTSGSNLIEKQRPNLLIESLTKSEFKNQLTFFRDLDYVALRIIDGEIFFVKDESIFDQCNKYDLNTIFIPT